MVSLFDTICIDLCIAPLLQRGSGDISNAVETSALKKSLIESNMIPSSSVFTRWACLQGGRNLLPRLENRSCLVRLPHFKILDALIVVNLYRHQHHTRARHSLAFAVSSKICFLVYISILTSDRARRKRSTSTIALICFMVIMFAISTAHYVIITNYTFLDFLDTNVADLPNIYTTSNIRSPSVWLPNSLDVINVSLTFVPRDGMPCS